MLYKETGQYKSTYKSDHAIFPLIQDKIAFSTLMFIAFLIIPFVINSYWEKAILVPFLIFSLAAIGLNILTGYCGQVSLGTGGFMAVGAFSTYKIMTYFPDLNIMIIVLISFPQITYCIADSAGGGLSLQAVTPTQPMPEEEEVDITIVSL